MNKFKVIQPSVLLAPYVKQYWFLRMEDVVRSSQRLVPLGCVVLSFHRGNFTYSSQEKDYLPRSHFYGITADYTDLVFSGCVDFISIGFSAGGDQPILQNTSSRMEGSSCSARCIGGPGIT